MLRIAVRHRAYRQTYERLKQQQSWLRRIERILDPNRIPTPLQPGPERAIEAAWELESFLLEVDRYAQVEPEHQPFINHVRKWVRNLGKGLFTCFHQPLLPRTNNDLERFLRRLKGQHRRITGRRSWNAYVLRHGAQVAFHDPTDPPDALLRRIRKVPFVTYHQKRSYWWNSLEPSRKRYRYRRDPRAYLKRLEEAWSS